MLTMSSCLGCGNPVEVMSAVSSTPDLMISELKVWTAAKQELDYTFTGVEEDQADESHDLSRHLPSHGGRMAGGSRQRDHTEAEQHQHILESWKALGLVEVTEQEDMDPDSQPCAVVSWQLSQKGWRHLTALQYFHNPQPVFKESMLSRSS